MRVICLSITILLEVLLVRSVPCRLGISSDIALSCCLSFANLSGENLNIQKKEEGKKKGHAPANEYLDLIFRLDVYICTHRLTHGPRQRQQLKHHPVLVKVSVELLEVFVLPLDGPVEVAVSQLHRVQGAYVDLEDSVETMTKRVRHAKNLGLNIKGKKSQHTFNKHDTLKAVRL